MTPSTLVPVATTDLKLHPDVTGLDEDVLVRAGYALPDSTNLDHPDLAELLDSGAISDGEPVGPGLGDAPRVFVRATVEKYNLPEGVDPGDDTPGLQAHIDELLRRIENPDAAPDETVEGTPNLLTIGGASQLIQSLLGNGTATAAQALTFLNNTQANLEVGDSTTAAADTQTALQAATNKQRKAMDATYPQHTDSTSVTGAKSFTLRATFGTTEGNFAWQEWGIFNATTAGRMFNRKVESLGTKTSAASWVLTITLSFA